MEARRSQVPRIALSAKSGYQRSLWIQTIQRNTQRDQLLQISRAHVDGMVQTILFGRTIQPNTSINGPPRGHRISPGKGCQKDL